MTGWLTWLQHLPSVLVGHAIKNPNFKPWLIQNKDFKIDACHHIPFQQDKTRRGGTRKINCRRLKIQLMYQWTYKQKHQWRLYKMETGMLLDFLSHVTPLWIACVPCTLRVSIIPSPVCGVVYKVVSSKVGPTWTKPLSPTDQSECPPPVYFTTFRCLLQSASVMDEWIA